MDRFLPLKTSIHNASPIIYTRSVYSKVVLKKNHLLWDSCQWLIHLFQTTYRPPCRNPKKLLLLQGIKLLQPGLSGLISLTWYKELVLHCIKCLAIYNNIIEILTFPQSPFSTISKSPQNSSCKQLSPGFSPFHQVKRKGNFKSTIFQINRYPSFFILCPITEYANHINECRQQYGLWRVAGDFSLSTVTKLNVER